MLGLPDGVTACLFDLDGVLTKTAAVHAKAWKEMFDAYLKERGDESPFDLHDDYDEYVDGKPRDAGVRDFLASRDIHVSEDEVSELGDRKNDIVLGLIKRDGVEAYPGSVDYLKAVKAAGLRRAVVSSSHNCQDVLEAAGIAEYLEARVDGLVADELHLHGKPAPDTFLEGAKRLGVEPAQAAVFEDALAGVAAGHAGHFGHVIGVDRAGQRDALHDHGADVVVDDLAELLPVITHPAFSVEPWAVTEDGVHLDVLAQSESVLALSNGHIGLRGNLDEGEPFGLPGTYLNAFYEIRPLPYAEAGYSYPEDGQTVVNVTNGKIIRLLVDDEPFDIRYGELLEHRRTLDLRAGVLRRYARWRSPAGREVEVTSIRLVSFAQRSVAAIRYCVNPCDDKPLRVVVQSTLVANEPGAMQSGDPRAAAVLAAPLVAEDQELHDLRATLVHKARASGLRMAAGMNHEVDGPEGIVTAADVAPDLARVIFSAELAPGEEMTVTKYLAYGWSSRRSLPSVRDQVDAALLAAKGAGWDTLLQRQHEYLDDFWARADVEIEGDEELQQAVRFGLFHTLQAGARAEQRAIPAKGLTGSGYDGHAFWDTESFVLPVLTYTAPDAAADALRWRHSTLDLARERAATLHLEGAAFPWRTIRGHECSAYWPAGTAAFHVNADIADATLRYLRATGDDTFAAEIGLELLVETARLWRSLGHHDSEGVFHIDGVTGPDEILVIADDNVYTNLMAERNLRNAADLAARLAEPAARLGVDAEEIASWRDAAAAMHVPYDERLGVHPQDANFLHHPVPDFARWGEDDYPLLLHLPYFQLYRWQVVKQPDLVLALLARGDRFTPEQKARDFAYYEAITVRDSSLSACIQSVVAAEVGHLELAYDYFGEAALMDLGDLEHNTRDGLHMASLAGSWIAAVAGFGGVRDSRRGLTFRPRLPAAISRLRFRMLHMGRCLCADVTHSQVVYELVDGEAMDVFHHDERVRLAPGKPVTRAWTTPDAGPEPTQPPGRAPARRRPR